ncbi:MAG: 16S rRNA (cytosine(1402)-N(4))-methyltransferase RsmH [Thermodesulfovibrionales bacterium]|nr:16S rRNA (cytosine(1402)-N(4))-methyltransferase RsmH [Thermodesulfovibrionales bacterium]
MDCRQDTYENIIHIPVLLEETISMLITERKGVYIDATTGTGGHSSMILSNIDKEGQLISIDRDEKALQIASKRTSDNRQIFIKSSFSELDSILSKLNIDKVDGVLFDLGLSTLQLRDYERGFSFESTERLDMRMDIGQSISAYEIVNSYSENQLSEIIKLFGEERQHKKIARCIALERKKKPISTCKELASIVAKAIGYKGKIHPATKTFQALRIEVNNEINELKTGLLKSINVLKKGGRICVLSYHSLEDRQVKVFFKENEKEGVLKIITKKPVIPSQFEIRQNRASRSAKLRVGEKL